MLSLAFGGDEPGWPGFTMPWKDRRVDAPELHVVLVPKPLEAVVAARGPAAVDAGSDRPTSLIAPTSQPPPAPDSAAGLAESPTALSVSIAPTSIPPKEPHRAEVPAQPDAATERNAATGLAVAQAPPRAVDERSDASPASSARPEVIALPRSDEPAWFVASPPPAPPSATSALSAASSASSVDAASTPPRDVDQAVQPTPGPAAVERVAEPDLPASQAASPDDAAAARLEAARSESLRNEARLEAAARSEAEQQEAARARALRADAARRENERLQGLQNATERQEAAKLASAEAEAARAAAAASASARLQAERQAAAQQEIVRQEAARRELARIEAERAEAAQRSAARREASRIDAERNEAAQRAAAQQEAEKQEDARRQATRLEADRAEAAQRAAARQEAERADAAKAEAGRQQAERDAAAKQAEARQEAARGQAAQALQDEAAKREARLRALGRQLDEEADRRDAAKAQRQAAPSSSLPSTLNSARRGRLFGRVDPNAELILYAEAWTRKIQFNTTFDGVRDAASRAHKDPLVTVAVRHDGSIESVTFVLSSGVPDIDDAIRRIVQSQAPYAAFSPALAREFDVIEIRRTWYFDVAIRLY